MAMVRMPISWQAVITRIAISPRLAISTLRNIVAHPARLLLLQERADALLPLWPDAQPSDGRRRHLTRLLVVQLKHSTRHQLRRADARWPALPDVAQRRLHRGIQRHGWHHLMHQADRQ